MRLARIQEHLKAKGVSYQYYEEDGCGTIEFLHRGLSYHIWEYPEDDPGASSNVRTWGRMEDFEGDYEDAIIRVMEKW